MNTASVEARLTCLERLADLNAAIPHLDFDLIPPLAGFWRDIEQLRELTATMGFVRSPLHRLVRYSAKRQEAVVALVVNESLRRAFSIRLESAIIRPKADGDAIQKYLETLAERRGLEDVILDIDYTKDGLPPFDLDEVGHYYLQRHDAQRIVLVLKLWRKIIRAQSKASVPSGAASGHSHAPAGCSHSTDFSTVNWFGRQFFFTGYQRDAVERLWTEWERGGHGLKEATIGEDIGTSAGTFRLAHLFRNNQRDATTKMHEAWLTMIVRVGPGCYKLAEPESPKNPI